MVRVGSQWRLWGVSLLAVAGALHCGPMRNGFDVIVPPIDVQAPLDAEVDAGDAGNGGDTRADARRDVTVIDTAPACDDVACDELCVGAGARAGFCRSTGDCYCRDLPDGVTLDTSMTAPDGMSTGPVVMGCGSNAECPPTMFCNGSGCEGRGFCAFRGEADPMSCPTGGTASCGCDGRLYPSVCARLSTGVRLAPRAMCSGSDGGASDAGPVDAPALVDAPSPSDAALTDAASSDATRTDALSGDGSVDAAVGADAAALDSSSGGG